MSSTRSRRSMMKSGNSRPWASVSSFAAQSTISVSDLPSAAFAADAMAERKCSRSRSLSSKLSEIDMAGVRVLGREVAKPSKCSAPRDDRQGQAGNAGQPAAVVLDADFPDLGAAPDVQRARGAGDPAFAHAGQVVGVDLDADHALALVHAHPAGGAAQGLGQQHRGAAVEQAV